MSDAEREHESDEHRLALVSAVCSLAVAYEVLRYRVDLVRVRHPEPAA